MLVTTTTAGLSGKSSSSRTARDGESGNALDSLFASADGPGQDFGSFLATATQAAGRRNEPSARPRVTEEKSPAAPGATEAPGERTELAEAPTDPAAELVAWWMFQAVPLPAAPPAAAPSTPTPAVASSASEVPGIKLPAAASSSRITTGPTVFVPGEAVQPTAGPHHPQVAPEEAVAFQELTPAPVPLAPQHSSPLLAAEPQASGTERAATPTVVSREGFPAEASPETPPPQLQSPHEKTAHAAEPPPQAAAAPAALEAELPTDDPQLEVAQSVVRTGSPNRIAPAHQQIALTHAAATVAPSETVLLTRGDREPNSIVRPRLAAEDEALGDGTTRHVLSPSFFDLKPQHLAGPEPHSDHREPRPVVEQVVDQIVTQLEITRRDGRTEFHLRLDPPNLGRVSIHLSYAENRLTARLVAHDEATRQMLEAQTVDLRVRMGDAGVALGGFDLAQQDPGTQDRWNQRQSVPRGAADLTRSGGNPSGPAWASLPRRGTGMIDVVA